MTVISLHMQWPLTSQWHGSVSQREQFVFVTDQTPRPYPTRRLPAQKWDICYVFRKRASLGWSALEFRATPQLIFWEPGKNSAKYLRFWLKTPFFRRKLAKTQKTLIDPRWNAIKFILVNVVIFLAYFLLDNENKINTVIRETAMLLVSKTCAEAVKSK
jgi:hypothetical protein